MAEHNFLLDLIQRAQQGDQEAWTVLLNRFRPLIRACCRGLDATNGQDLEQELYIQLVRLVRRYQVKGSIDITAVLHEDSGGHNDGK